LVAARSSRIHVTYIARDWFLILDFGFWAARAAARRNDPHYLLSAAHVNQKSFDMTTPNDKLVRAAADSSRADRSRVARMMIGRGTRIQIAIAKINAGLPIT
jgi:hypothetical protein